MSTATYSNEQIGSAASAGGTAPTSVLNQAGAAVIGTGTAEGQSGAGGAPTGDASAIGAATTSAVATTTTAAVGIGGANHAPVSVTSTNVMSVAGAATAAAATGGAAPSLGGAAPPSGTGCESGLVALNSVAATSSVRIEVHGTAAPVTVDQTASATTEAVGVAPGPSPSATALVGAAATSSGAATAGGLVARDRVDLLAEVIVRIAGENHGLIDIVVETATRIRNIAAAAAMTGAEAIGAHGTAPALTSVTDAIGAVVRNSVELASSVVIAVTGDNHSPIRVLVDLAASLFNWGRADARSAGDATALGLDARSLVDLSAFVRIDISGSNYAPIRVVVRLGADIWNEGYAYAFGGDTLVSGPVPESGAELDGVARSGDATCIGAASAVQMSNTQVAAARAETPTAGNAGDLKAALEGSAACGTGDVSVAADAADVVAESGDAFAVGAELAVSIASQQEAIARAGDREEPQLTDPAPDAAPIAAPEPAAPAAPASAPAGGPEPPARPLAAAPENTRPVPPRAKVRAGGRTTVVRQRAPIRIRTLPSTATPPGDGRVVQILLPAASAALWIVWASTRRSTPRRR